MASVFIPAEAHSTAAVLPTDAVAVCQDCSNVHEITAIHGRGHINSVMDAGMHHSL